MKRAISQFIFLAGLLAVVAPLFLVGCQKSGGGAAKQNASIFMRSNVANATTTLNGQPCNPVEVTGLAPGSYLLRASKPGYDEIVRTVTLIGNRTEIELEFQPVKGFALITSNPPGAEVNVAGESGLTPFVLREIPLDEYRVSLSKPGFTTINRTLKIDDRIPVLLNVDMNSNSGSLTVNTTPSGAKITLDGEYKGLSSATFSSLPSGRYDLNIEKNGYKPFGTRVTITPGGNEVLDADLEALPGSIMVNTTPPKARVYINEKFVSVAPALKKDLAPGAHTIRVEKEGFGATTEQIILANGQDLDHKMTLEKNVGTLLLTTEPANVEVIVDGKRIGLTRTAGTDAVSAVFTVGNLKRGEHNLQLVKKGYKFEPKTFNIEAEKSTELQEKMTKFFIKDHVVWTGKNKDSRWTGMLIERYPNGDIRMEINPGIYRDFSHKDIIKEEPYKKGLD